MGPKLISSFRWPKRYTASILAFPSKWIERSGIPPWGRRRSLRQRKAGDNIYPKNKGPRSVSNQKKFYLPVGSSSLLNLSSRKNSGKTLIEGVYSESGHTLLYSTIFIPLVLGSAALAFDLSGINLGVERFQS